MLLFDVRTYSLRTTTPPSVPPASSVHHCTNSSSRTSFATHSSYTFLLFVPVAYPLGSVYVIDRAYCIIYLTLFSFFSRLGDNIRHWFSFLRHRQFRRYSATYTTADHCTGGTRLPACSARVTFDVDCHPSRRGAAQIRQVSLSNPVGQISPIWKTDLIPYKSR